MAETMNKSGDAPATAWSKPDGLYQVPNGRYFYVIGGVMHLPSLRWAMTPFSLRGFSWSFLSLPFLSPFPSLHARSHTNLCSFPSLHAPGTRTGWE
jgi:hypothetical protein